MSIIGFWLCVASKQTNKQYNLSMGLGLGELGTVNSGLKEVEVADGVSLELGYG